MVRGRLLKRVSLTAHLLQVRTALADTPGSVFFANCEAVFTEARFEELLNIFIEKFSLLFSKATDGAARSPWCLAAEAHIQLFYTANTGSTTLAVGAPAK